MEQNPNETLAELIVLFSQAESEMEKLTAESDGIVQTAKDNLFRTFHTIKGVAGLAGMRDLCQLSTKLEGLCHCLRLGQLCLSAEIIQLGQLCLASMQKSLVAQNPDQIGTIANLAERSDQIQRLLDKKICVLLTEKEKDRLLAKANIDPRIVASFIEYEETRLFETLKQDKGLRKLRVSCSHDEISNDKLPQVQQLIRDKKLGEIIATFPDNQVFTATEMIFWIYLGSSLPEEIIRGVLSEFQVEIEQDLSFTDDDMPWGID